MDSIWFEFSFNMILFFSLCCQTAGQRPSALPSTCRCQMLARTRFSEADRPAIFALAIILRDPSRANFSPKIRRQVVIVFLSGYKTKAFNLVIVER